MGSAPTTDDPKLRLMIDRRLLVADRVENGAHIFELPGGAREIRIVSRSVVPSALDPAHRDGRRLGIGLRALTLQSPRLDVMLRWDDPALVDGFHQPEHGFRWTDGCGLLPASLFAPFTEPFTLRLDLLATTLRYPLDADIPA